MHWNQVELFINLIIAFVVDPIANHFHDLITSAHDLIVDTQVMTVCPSEMEDVLERKFSLRVAS